MKNSLLILAGTAALSLASCSQEKTTEVATTPGDATMTTTTTAYTPMSDADMEARAQRIADKMVADMKITDDAMKTKIRTVYVNRYKRMNEMRGKYTTDTTGMAASMRESNMATDTEFKSVFTDPAQYQSYESSRTTYYGMDDDNSSSGDATGSMSSDNMSSDNTSSGSMSSDNMSSDNSMSSTDNTMSGTDGAEVSKMKAKAADGSKIKIKEDGKVKTKDADGSKSKN